MNKRITFNRDSKDFDMYLNEEYVGSRERHHEAEVELDRLAYEALAHNPGPVELAVEGALDRLADDHSRHAATADTSADRAYFRRATTSYTNALIQYRAGVRPELLQSGAWLLPSSRAGEPPHIVRMDGDWVCGCKVQASMHWPIALVIGIEQANEDMQNFDDGDVEEEAALDGPALLAERLDATAAILDVMRAAQGRAALSCDPPAPEPNPLGDTEDDPDYPLEDRSRLGRRIAAARRPLFAAYDAETARRSLSSCAARRAMTA